MPIFPDPSEHWIMGHNINFSPPRLALRVSMFTLKTVAIGCWYQQSPDDSSSILWRTVYGFPTHKFSQYSANNSGMTSAIASQQVSKENGPSAGPPFRLSMPLHCSCAILVASQAFKRYCPEWYWSHVVTILSAKSNRTALAAVIGVCLNFIRGELHINVTG